MAIGAVIVDDVYQHLKGQELEQALARSIAIAAVQHRVNDSCMGSLYSCRSLADSITIEGQKMIPSRLSPSTKQLKKDQRRWQLARASEGG